MSLVPQGSFKDHEDIRQSMYDQKVTILALIEFRLAVIL